jgi:hypothetical protein
MGTVGSDVGMSDRKLSAWTEVQARALGHLDAARNRSRRSEPVADKFYAPSAGPVSVTLTAVTVPHPSREGHWLPGLYRQLDGDERASTALLLLPGVAVRAGDFEPGARVTVTVETAKENTDA